MTSKSRTRLRRTLCVVLVAVAGAALAADIPRGLEGGEKVRVSLAMLSTLASGATTEALVLHQDLGIGQSMVLDAMGGHGVSFAAGGDPSGCSERMAVQSAESQVADNAVAWDADATVLEASTDRLVLSASWRRFERGSDGRPVEAAHEEIQRIELREGQRVLLDLARVTGSRCFRNAALELSARVAESPELAQRQVSYDVWLVHETKGGRRTARAQLTAAQGEELPFAFPAEKLAADASVNTDDALRVAVTGRIRGRLRPDGTIDVSLSSARMLSYVAADGRNDGGIGDSGEKLVRVHPGEAIRVDMPSPDQTPARNDPRALPMAKDLAGHRYAVILRAKPI